MTKPSEDIAINVDTAVHEASTHRAAEQNRQRQLTPRELEVLDQITSGATNREASARLGISQRTVEVHRYHIMHKLKARNIADLVRIALTGYAQA